MRVDQALNHHTHAYLVAKKCDEEPAGGIFFCLEKITSTTIPHFCRLSYHQQERKRDKWAHVLAGGVREGVGRSRKASIASSTSLFGAKDAAAQSATPRRGAKLLAQIYHTSDTYPICCGGFSNSQCMLTISHDERASNSSLLQLASRTADQHDNQRAARAQQQQ